MHAFDPGTQPQRFLAGANAGPRRRRRRVLFVDHTASLGGGEIALLNLIRGLDRTRFEPIVLLFSEGPLIQQLRQLRTRVHVIPLASSIVDTRKERLGAATFLRVGDFCRGIGTVLRVAEFMRHEAIDLVHTNSLKADIVGGAAARIAGKTLLWQIRDRIDPDYLPTSVTWAFRGLCRIIPDFLVANSFATLDCVTRIPARVAAHPPWRIGGRQTATVVHDGVDVATFHPPAQRILMGVPTLGLVGRISPFKGQDVFIRAAAMVHRQFPEARFKIVGSALFGEREYEQRVRDLVQSLGMGEVIEFVGFRDDVHAVYGELDILVHASVTGEPFGQVVIEAMATGRPVVATRGGGVPEIVIDGETGLLVSMREAPAMASAMCRMLADPPAAREMGRRGRQRVEEHFTIQQTVAKMERFYEAVFAGFEAKSRSRPPELGGPPSVAEPRPESSKRVLYVNHTARLGGGELALLKLIQHLDSGRYEPVVVLFEQGPLVGRLAHLGITPHVISLAESVVDTRKEALGIGMVLRLRDVTKSIDCISRLAAFIRLYDIDLIHANSLKADVIGGIAAKLTGTPLLWHIRDRIDSDYLPPVAAWVFRAMCRIIPDFIVANSAATLSHVARVKPNHSVARPWMSRKQQLSRVVYSGVDVNAFRPSAHPVLAGIPTIGLVGRLSPFKGQDVFIRAAAMVHRQFPAARFKIVGSALFGEREYEQRVRELVQSLGMGDVIEFVGFRNDVDAAFGELDILVHASVTGEPFGQVVIEAMATGRPVVATRGGGIPEIVVDGETGLLVPMRDETAMANAISILLANPPRAREMGVRGRKRVEEHFTIQQTVAWMEAFYEQIFLVA